MRNILQPLGSLPRRDFDRLDARRVGRQPEEARGKDNERTLRPRPWPPWPSMTAEDSRSSLQIGSNSEHRAPLGRSSRLSGEGTPPCRPGGVVYGSSFAVGTKFRIFSNGLGDILGCIPGTPRA